MQLSSIVRKLASADSAAPRATVVIRLMVGAVFVSEGILKFVYTNQGIGRFTKLGFPIPDATATFVGAFEIVGLTWGEAGFGFALVSDIKWDELRALHARLH